MKNLSGGNDIMPREKPRMKDGKEVSGGGFDFITPALTASFDNVPGMTTWIYGRMGAGKTTAAEPLHHHGMNLWIDGDVIRSGMNEDLCWSYEDIKENIRRIVALCKLANKQGIGVVVSVVTPFRHLREYIRANLSVRLIYVCTPKHIAKLRREKLYSLDTVVEFEEPNAIEYDQKIYGYPLTEEKT